LIFGEYTILWLEKKRIGESFKVQFGEKNPIIGKNRQSFKTTKLKKKHPCTHVHNSFFLGRIFALCLQMFWKFGDSSFSWCKIKKKSPQIEEKFAKNKEILKAFKVLTTKLRQKKNRFRLHNVYCLLMSGV